MLTPLKMDVFVLLENKKHKSKSN